MWKNVGKVVGTILLLTGVIDASSPPLPASSSMPTSIGGSLGDKLKNLRFFAKENYLPRGPFYDYDHMDGCQPRRHRPPRPPRGIPPNGNGWWRGWGSPWNPDWWWWSDYYYSYYQDNYRNYYDNMVDAENERWWVRENNELAPYNWWYGNTDFEEGITETEDIYG